MISDTLGDDFIVVDIQAYASSASNEVYTPRLQSFTSNGWIADYTDPYSYVSQYILGFDGAFYTKKYTHLNEVTDPELVALCETYTDMVEEASAITDDMHARYEKFAEAEAFWLNHALSVPSYQSVSWALRNDNIYSRATGSYIYKNWETSKSGYTTAEYELIKEQYYAELAAMKDN